MNKQRYLCKHVSLAMVINDAKNTPYTFGKSVAYVVLLDPNDLFIWIYNYNDNRKNI